MVTAGPVAPAARRPHRLRRGLEADLAALPALWE